MPAMASPLWQRLTATPSSSAASRQAGEVRLAGRDPVGVARIGHRRAKQGCRRALEKQPRRAAQRDFRPAERQRRAQPRRIVADQQQGERRADHAGWCCAAQAGQGRIGGDGERAEAAAEQVGDEQPACRILAERNDGADHFPSAAMLPKMPVSAPTMPSSAQVCPAMPGSPPTRQR